MLVGSVGDAAASTVLDGPLLLAVLLALAAGAASFFSPCCLPLVPGYLSYVTGLTGAETRALADARVGASVGMRAGLGAGVAVAPDATAARWRTTLGALLFVVGFAAVFTGYGAAFGTFGQLLVAHQDALVRVLGLVTIVLGLLFTGLLWRLPFAGRTFRVRYRPRGGLIGAPVVGVLFGLGWTPCIGPTLAAVLALATSTADASRGAVLSFAYSLGLGLPFILAAASVHRLVSVSAWARRHAREMMRTGGAVLVLLGVLQVTGLWTSLIARLQGMTLSWVPPL